MYNVSQQKLIELVASDLKEIISKPEWADYVKTGAHKERPPTQDDWWYIRAAAVLRSIDKLGPVGVSKLRTKYGGKKNRGVAPGKHVRGSGSILRHIMQELEAAGFAKQEAVGVHKGRIITPKGKSLFFAAAKKIGAEKPKATAKPKVNPAEDKPKAEASKVESKSDKSADAKPVDSVQKAED